MTHPTSDERTADQEQAARRQAERVALPLRCAYRDLPATDARFAKLLDQLRGVMPARPPEP